MLGSHAQVFHSCKFEEPVPHARGPGAPHCPLTITAKPSIPSSLRLLFAPVPGNWVLRKADLWFAPAKPAAAAATKVGHLVLVLGHRVPEAAAPKHAACFMAYSL